MAMDDITHRVVDMADKIQSEFSTLCTLAYQHTRYKSASFQTHPFPLSTSESKANPQLLSQMLHYEGSCEDFIRALMESTQYAGEDMRYAVAVTQAPGSGKTRLAYEAGTRENGSCVVFVRTASQHSGGLSEPWEAWKSCTRSLPASDGARQNAKIALAMMKLLVCSYIDWVTLVLRKLSVSMPDITTRQKREAALRCLGNGRGDRAVKALFERRIAEFFTEHPGDAVRSRIDAYCEHVITELRDILAPACSRICIFFDEVQQLIGVMKSTFFPFSTLADEEEELPTKDAFYALTCIMPEFLENPCVLQQVVCGSWLDISDRISFDMTSPLHSKLTTVYHASRLEVADMEQSMRRYFSLPADFFKDEEISACLQSLVGRPKGFFYHVWTRIFSALTFAAAPTTATIAQAIKDGCDRALQNHKQFIHHLWNNDESSKSAQMLISSVVTDLYYSIKFKDGMYDTRKHGKLAAQVGLLAYNPDVETVVDLHREPFTFRSVESVGNQQVWSENDPILQVLHEELEQAKTADTLHHMMGKVQQKLLCWHFIKCRLRNVENLRDIAGSMCTPEVKSLDMVDCNAVTVRYALSAEKACAKFAASSAFECLLKPGSEEYVIYGLPEQAGANVICTCIDTRGNKRLVVVHSNVEADDSLMEAVRAATPAWQYLNRAQRERIVDGKPIAPGVTENISAKSAVKLHISDDALTYWRLWSKENERFFITAVRMVFALGRYDESCFTVIPKINASEEGRHSPVLLCRSDGAFGEISKALVACSPGFHVSASPLIYAYLYPQTLGDVLRSSVVKESVKGRRA